MLFTDKIFLFAFLPTILVALRFITSRGRPGEFTTIARLVLFLSTLAFYGYGSAWWLGPFLVSIAFDFLWAHLLSRTDDQTRRKWYLLFSVIQNLSMLALFKYRKMIGEAVSFVSPETGDLLTHCLRNVPEGLPAGISFYTFESMSFVIDVYRREVTPPKRALEFFAFIGMFPRFVAGPIVRYRQMVSQFAQYRGMQIEHGLCVFAAGFFLKSCFADNFAKFVRFGFSHPDPGLGNAWLGAIAFTMQLYFDFSGYSLMAIGLGRCLGFSFPKNFDLPYLSVSWQEFWRRWHITLSTWLRDYLYISLGGNRKGPFRTHLNLMITMVLGGLWHGAQWTFMIWGAWHGLLLTLDRLLPAPSGKFFVRARMGLTFLGVVVGWVVFHAESFGDARRVLGAMFQINHAGGVAAAELFRDPAAAAACLAGLIYCFFLEKHVDYYEWPAETIGWRRPVAALLVVASLPLDGLAQSIPFLYFQF